MTSILKVVIRCLVVEFYKQNAAFFGLIFLIFFGFIKSNEHIVIGSFLVANPSALAYLYVLWLAYGVKVMLFVLPAINKTENQFLASFYLLPHNIKNTTVILISLLLLIPIGAYLLFLLVLAFSNVFYGSILSLLLSFSIITIVLSALILHQINMLPHETSFFQLRFLNKTRRPTYLFFIEHLVRNDFILLFLTKVYTCLVIIGTTSLYSTDQFDLRLLTTGVLLAFVGNVAILHKYVWFQYHKMTFSANLPLSFLKIITHLIFIFSLLLIPEFLVLLRHYPLAPNLPDVSGEVLFGLSLIFLIYGVLLKKQVELSNFIVVIFWMVVSTTFFILFSIHPFFLAIINFFISTSLIYFRYRKFEYIEKSH